MTAWVCRLLLLAGLFAPARAHADADALWHFIHDRCAPGAALSGNPAPCALVAYPQGAASGYVVFKDRNGVAQYLLMPVAKITGIEDPAILAPDATNYFAAAWRHRGFMLAKLGRDLPRDAISLAINSPTGRSQNQLHIHIDCIAPAVRAALRAQLPGIGAGLAPLGVALAGHTYRAMRIDDAELAHTDPFRLLAQDPTVGAAGMHRHTLVLVGARFADGADGFVLLDDAADPLRADPASGEELQDHSCAVAQD